VPLAGVIKLAVIVPPIRVIAIVPPIKVIAIVHLIKVIVIVLITKVAMAIGHLIVVARPLATAEQALEAKSPDVAKPRRHPHLDSKFEVLLEQVLVVVGVFGLEQRLNLVRWNRPSILLWLQQGNV